MATICLHPPPDRARLEERMLVHGFTPVEDLRGPLWLALERLGEALSVAANLRIELRKARATIDRQGTELGQLRKAHLALPEKRLSRAEVRSALESVIFGERGCQPGTCTAVPPCRNRAEMRAAHGTPAEFANGIARAAAEMSVAEADRAVASYLKAWEAATEPDAALQRALNSELAAMGCDPVSATQAEVKQALFRAQRVAGMTSMLAEIGAAAGVDLLGTPEGTEQRKRHEGYLVHPSMAPYFQTMPRTFGPPPGAVGQHVDQIPDLSTPIGAPSLAVAEQFDAEARTAAEEPGMPGDIESVEIDIPPMPVQLAEHRRAAVDLWPGSGLPPLLSVDRPMYRPGSPVIERAPADYHPAEYRTPEDEDAAAEQAERFQGLDDSDRE